uniref:BESS domain-containing protein n=2 Tax=Anopheles merus TaxID=30066 RepID=A0A182UQB6_ANOME
MNNQSTQTSEATGKSSPRASSAPRKPSLQVSILPPQGQSSGAILTIRTPIEIKDGPVACVEGHTSTARPIAPIQPAVRSTGTSTEAGGASASSATPTVPKQQTAWQRAVNAISMDDDVDLTSLVQELQPYVTRLPTIKKLMIYKKMLEMVQEEYVKEVKKQCPNTRTDHP